MPKGIPHSVFLGRVVVPGVDPQWTDEDQDRALAWERENARLCRGCGTRSEEWDPKQGGDRHAYLGARRYCPGCEVLHQEGRMIREDQTSYVHVHLVPKELARDDDEEHGGP